jgi:hypothetical protein
MIRRLTLSEIALFIAASFLLSARQCKNVTTQLPSLQRALDSFFKRSPAQLAE